MPDCWDSFCDLIFVPRCLACGAAGAYLCPDCLAGLRYLAPPLCRRCGAPLPIDGRCATCRRHRPSFRSASSLCVYEGAMRSFITRFKFKPVHRSSAALRDVLDGWHGSDALPPADLLTFVPLHPVRQAARGFNQSELIAAACGRRIGLKPRVALVKVRQTKAQNELAEDERLRNLAGAFRALPTAAGRKVIVVDDVFTTGATLSACAAALVQGGAKWVHGLTLARRIYT